MVREYAILTVLTLIQSLAAIVLVWSYWGDRVGVVAHPLRYGEFGGQEVGQHDWGQR